MGVFTSTVWVYTLVMREIVKCEALWVNGEITHHEIPLDELPELSGEEVIDYIETSLDKGPEIESVDYWLEKVSSL